MDQTPLTAPASPGSPNSPVTGEARLAQARRRVAALKGFYIHLVAFALVLLGLLLVNSATGGPWWVVWVFLGWGLGVLAHGLAVAGLGSRTIAAWEERKVRDYLAADNNGPGQGRGRGGP
jgi:2TM domain-containing protein